MRVVDFIGDHPLSSNKLRELFSGRFQTTGGPTAYDVSLNGKRLLMVEMLDPPKQPVAHFRIVQNWFEELKARVPTK